jgi:hypothetical protein
MASGAKEEHDGDIIELTDVVEEGQPAEKPARVQAKKERPQEEAAGSEQDELDAAFSRLFADDGDSGASSSEDPDIEFGSFFDEMDDTAEGLKDEEEGPSAEEQPEIELSDIEEISDLEQEPTGQDAKAKEPEQELQLSDEQEQSLEPASDSDGQSAEEDWDLVAEKDTAESELDSNFNQLFGSEAGGSEAENSAQGLEGAEIDLESLFDELDKASRDEEPEEDTPEGIEASAEEPDFDDSLSPDLEMEEEPATESDEEPVEEETDEELNQWLDQLDVEHEESADSKESEDAAAEEPLEEPSCLDSDEMEVDGLEEIPIEDSSGAEMHAGALAARAGEQDAPASPELQTRMQELENRLQALEEQPQTPAAPDTSDLDSRIGAMLDTRLQDESFWNRLQERVAEVVDEKIQSGLEDRFAELQSRILEAVKSDESIPDAERLDSVMSEIRALRQQMVSRDELDGLSSRMQEDVSRQIRNAVPDAAAQIIREEIKALEEEIQKTDS